MAFYRDWLGAARQLRLVPVGADIKSNLWRRGNNSLTHNILFVGKMSAQPNEEAVIWFDKNIMPNVVKIFSDARFVIVGKEPTERVLSLAGDNVIVTGTVEETEKYYLDCDLVVLPLLHGGGVKVKLLEAISYGCPIVTTSVGVEGTEFKNDKFLKVCDSPAEFSKACIEFMSRSYCSDEELPENDNYELFIKTTTWEQIGKDYCNLFENIVENCQPL